MEQTYAKFRRLDADKIVETVRTLQKRIEERFPDAGLGKVVAELSQIADETVARAAWIQKPNLPLRFAAAVLSLVIIALLIVLLAHIREFKFDDFVNSMQGLDSAIGSGVFIRAAVLVFFSLGARIQRRPALQALHRLPAPAHI